MPCEDPNCNFPHEYDWVFVEHEALKKKGGKLVPYIPFESEKFWCPICPKCKEPIPTNHSRCKCND